MGVQHGGGLVHNKAVGPHGDNARNRDALLLAAGQLVRRSLALFIDARQLHGLVDAGADLLGRYARFSGAKATSSSTMVATIWLSGFWNTMPTFWRTS